MFFPFLLKLADGEQIACPGGTTTSSNTASSAGECVSTQPPDQPMTGPVGNPLNPTEPPGLNPSPPQTPPQDAPANPEPSSPAPSPPRPPVLTPVPASKCNPCADANPVGFQKAPGRSCHCGSHSSCCAGRFCCCCAAGRLGQQPGRPPTGAQTSTTGWFEFVSWLIVWLLMTAAVLDCRMCS